MGKGKKGLYYRAVEAADGQIYSVDKVVQNFTLFYRPAWEPREEKFVELPAGNDKEGAAELPPSTGQVLLDGISAMMALEYRHWTTFKGGSYRDQFSFQTDTGGSFWLGVGLNCFGKKTEYRKCRMEWNPNKVGYTREFVSVYNLVMSLSKYADIKQFDLAVDIPAERASVSLCKDGRLYEEMMHSQSNRTQYVGQRNAAGRVKVYNKTAEAGLDEAVTRMELTLSMDDLAGGAASGWAAVRTRWPRVYIMGDIQVGMDTASMNDTDLFIFKTLLDAPERLPELGRRLREKFAPLLEKAGCLLAFDPVAFGGVVDILAEYKQLLADVGRPVFERKWYEPYENEIEEFDQWIER